MIPFSAYQIIVLVSILNYYFNQNFQRLQITVYIFKDLSLYILLYFKIHLYSFTPDVLPFSFLLKHKTNERVPNYTNLNNTKVSTGVHNTIFMKAL